MKQIKITEVRNIIDVEIPSNCSKVSSHFLFAILKKAIGVDGGQILGFYSPLQNTMRSPSSLFSGNFTFLAFLAIENEKKLFGLNFKTWKVGEIVNWQEVIKLCKEGFVLYNRGTGMSFDLDMKQMNKLRDERAGIIPPPEEPKPKVVTIAPPVVPAVPLTGVAMGKKPSKAEQMRLVREKKGPGRRSPQQREQDFSIYRVGVSDILPVQNIKSAQPESLCLETLHAVVRSEIQQTGGRPLGFFEPYGKNKVECSVDFLKSPYIFLSIFYIKRKERIFAINFKTWQIAELKWSKVRGTSEVYALTQYEGDISFERKNKETKTEVADTKVVEPIHHEEVETQPLPNIELQLSVQQEIQETNSAEQNSTSFGNALDECFQRLGYFNAKPAELSFIGGNNTLVYEATNGKGESVYVIYVAVQRTVYEIKTIG